MPTLWDVEMPPFQADLGALTEAQRLTVSMKVLQWTRDEFGPIEVSEVRDYLDTGIRLGWDAVNAGRDKIDLPEEMLDSYLDVDDMATDFGTSQLLSALLACADAPDGLTGEVAYGALNFCYEAILIKEIPDPSLERERQNHACVEAIRVQQEVIRAARGG